MVTKDKSESRPMTEEADFLKIKSIDYVNFYVGNAKQAMYYWWKAFGFKPVAYSGLETGNREFASYVLESGQARFVVSAPYSPSSPIASHHMVHGDGIKSIALEVDDVEKHGKKPPRVAENLLGHRVKKEMSLASSTHQPFTLTVKRCTSL
ncbi:MAG: hypothetical protein HC797_02900 [Anaerolineales bacterium]|nr:hypothetical protein [Anaerolineales bacterium]